MIFNGSDIKDAPIPHSASVSTLILTFLNMLGFHPDMTNPPQMLFLSHCHCQRLSSFEPAPQNAFCVQVTALSSGSSNCDFLGSKGEVAWHKDHIGRRWRWMWMDGSTKHWTQFVYPFPANTQHWFLLTIVPHDPLLPVGLSWNHTTISTYFSPNLTKLYLCLIRTNLDYSTVRF